MNYLSVCSGIEAATVAWQPLGWTAVGFSEIEKFPNAVLAHHYPGVPNFGDMNDFKDWPNTDFDVLVGGTPCQAFSVAGLRQGMADPRGNLALVYLAIAAHYWPKWLVWENVSGVLSSNGGRDFGAIVGAMVKLGYGIAYRVLDAQHFGVPQRRRRVFVVGHLGDWRRAAQVLFEPQSLRRNPAPGRETRQGIAAPLTAGSAANSNPPGRRREDDENLVAKNVRTCSGGIDREDMHTLIPAVANPLTARMHKRINTTCDEGQMPIVTHALTGEGFDASEDGTSRGTPIVVHGTQEKNGGLVNAVAFAQNQRDEVRLMDKAGALAAEPGAKQQTYIFKQGQGAKAGGIGGSEHTAPTLSAGQSGTQLSPALLQNMAVRRLTPLECARLQGFPDDYFDGVPGRSDSQVYKALGNSMAVPVMRWIGERMAA